MTHPSQATARLTAVATIFAACAWGAPIASAGDIDERYIAGAVAMAQCGSPPITMIQDIRLTMLIATTANDKGGLAAAARRLASARAHLRLDCASPAVTGDARWFKAEVLPRLQVAAWR